MVYNKYKKNNLVLVKSQSDNNYYLVRNVIDKQKASNLLGKLRNDIFRLSNYMKDNINKNDEFKKMEPYILQLNRNIQDMEIRELEENSSKTSYSVNKGESIVFCIRSKDISKYIKSNNIHDYNLIMYVALHEIAHVGCPEYGHTKLFKDIFHFFCKVAIDIGIYEKIDFINKPENYCGLNINDSII